MLTERQRLILSAIVDDYIRYAEPVGSRSISKRSDVGYSPATIRNEMSDLEEMGYLEQPHTSAGRIPSHKGYRYYVDHLLKHTTLSKAELDMIKTFFARRLLEVEEVIQQVAVILSNLTHYTSIVLGPEVFSTSLKALQIVPLNDRQAVAVIVTSTGRVENRVVSIPEGISLSEIEKFVNLLNDKLRNVPLCELRTKLYNEIADELKKYVAGYEELIHMVESTVVDDEEDRIYLGGTTNMLIQPEFKDVEKVKSILDILEQTPTLVKMFSNAPAGIQVRIGSENNLEAINDCSLITATYSIDNQVLGTIGILGPTRMEYAKVITVLEHLTKQLAENLQRWYK
jgi:heat-inducible transcriptional repressor